MGIFHRSKKQGEPREGRQEHPAASGNERSAADGKELPMTDGAENHPVADGAEHSAIEETERSAADKTERLTAAGITYPATDGTAPEASQLQDFHPFDTGLAEAILTLSGEFKEGAASAGKHCSREQFMALLAGVPALRKTPGIPGPGESGPDYFTALPRCASPEAEAACRTHLEQVFGITDKQSLLDFCSSNIRCHHQYLDFVGFWEGHPPFDTAQLHKEALEFFQVARDFSAQFYPIVGHQGYLAWDISECMGHLRAGFACGLLTWEEFSGLSEYWVAQARTFQGWADFAVSLLCGGLYWDFRQGAKLPELNEGLNLWARLVRILLESDAAWGSGMWYNPMDELQ